MYITQACLQFFTVRAVRLDHRGFQGKRTAILIGTQMIGKCSEIHHSLTGMVNGTQGGKITLLPPYIADVDMLDPGGDRRIFPYGIALPMEKAEAGIEDQSVLFSMHSKISPVGERIRCGARHIFNKQPHAIGANNLQ